MVDQPQMKKVPASSQNVEEPLTARNWVTAVPAARQNPPTCATTSGAW